MLDDKVQMIDKHQAVRIRRSRSAFWNSLYSTFYLFIFWYSDVEYAVQSTLNTNGNFSFPIFYSSERVESAQQVQNIYHTINEQIKRNENGREPK